MRHGVPDAEDCPLKFALGAPPLRLRPCFSLPVFSTNMAFLPPPDSSMAWRNQVLSTGAPTAEAQYSPCRASEPVPPL